MIHLYVKTHNLTGLKYFGKTTHNPFKYKGSGKYWLRHIAKHGTDITTEIIGSFEDEKECSEFAINFSRINQIVNSDEWANLVEENGLDGAPIGHEGCKFSKEELEKRSELSRNRWKDPEYKKKLSEAQARSWTQERKDAQSKRMLGVSCPEHSERMRGRRLPEDHPWLSGAPKPDNHRKKISDSLKGRPKTEECKEKLRKPKPLVVCRMHDRKLMALGNFMKWYNLQTKADEV